jgi:hypothetical protein
MTALCNTTTAVSGGACSANDTSCSLRSPATSSGGSVRATAIAWRSRSRRKSCSGQINASSQATSSGSRMSKGFKSMPARHATAGSAAGSGTGPAVAQRSTG